MKVAALASEELAAIRTDLQSGSGGAPVHYGFAILAGTAYGFLVEASGVSGLAAGVAYAAALWLGSDFVLLPLTGLAHRVPKYGWRVEALSAAGHLVYGTVLELVREWIRTAL